MIGVIFMETSSNISNQLRGLDTSNWQGYFPSSIHWSISTCKEQLVPYSVCFQTPNTLNLTPLTLMPLPGNFFPENQFFTNYVVRSKNWLELRLNKCLKLFSPSCECLERMQTVRPHCNVPCSPPIVCSGFILLTINCLPDFSEYFYSLLFVSNETLTRL